MKAFGYKQFGDPDVFEQLELAEPKISKQNEVVIKTLAVGINNFERIQRAGVFKSAKLPLVPGRDIVGQVIKIGEQVKKITVGDIVIGHGGPSYAQFAVLPDDRLVEKPVNVSSAQAVTIVTPGITAYNAVTSFTHVRAGDRVLVNGATGGVGSIAVQVAKKLGAYVIGVGSSRNKSLLEELTLDEIGLYDQDNINEKFADQVDVVINAAMNGTNDTLIADVIHDGGRAASVGDATNLTEKPNVLFEHIRPLDAHHDQVALQALAEMLSDGSLKVKVFKTLPLSLAGVIDAHKLLEQRHAPGRIVLVNED